MGKLVHDCQITVGFTATRDDGVIVVTSGTHDIYANHCLAGPIIVPVGVVMGAENVKPSVLLSLGTRNGIPPV